MPISGYVAGGASEALEEVLDRRLKEQIRQQQEKEHADQVAHQRQQIDLQQRAQENLEKERQEDRTWHQGERDIATAQRAEADTDPGAITPEIAAVLSKDPAIAGRISQRKVIDATPIANLQSVLPGAVAPEPAGEAGPRLIESLGPRTATPAAIGGPVSTTTDASGPQQYPVLGATPKQAEVAKLKSDLETYNEELSRASGEDARRQVAARAARFGIRLDPNLVSATETEKQATARQKLLEEREYDEGEFNRRTAITEGNMRNRPSKGGLADLSPAGVSAVFKLQDDFQRDSKPFMTIRDAYQRVASVANEKGAVANMALVFGFMKILDPTSVVREGEYANAQNAANVPDRIRNMYNAAVKGGFLSENQTQDFARIAKIQYDDALKNQNQVVNQYTRRSSQLGLDPSYVVADLDTVGSGGKGDNIPKVVKDPKTGKWVVEK